MASHYYILLLTINWWKNGLILRKLNSIEWRYWITFHVTWKEVRFKYNLTINQFKFNSIHVFQFNWIESKFLNLIDLNSNSIEKKQDANWCKRYWKCIHKIWCWKYKLQKHRDLKGLLFIPLGNWLNKFQFGMSSKRRTYET